MTDEPPIQPTVSQAEAAALGLAKVTLGSSSVYPKGLETAFELAAQLGYDGVEVMVLGQPDTQDAASINTYAERYGVPVLSIHAPTLLVSQRVWGTNDPWAKIDKSIDLAFATGCDTVVLHPPFRWQRDYARGFVEGVAQREAPRDVVLAVENMYPWRAGSTWLQVYRPAWNPVGYPFAHTTLDFSHAAIAHDDVLEMKDQLGERLRHIHLCDGTGNFMDEHLVPGRGTMPVAEFMEGLGEANFDGIVAAEVGTRKDSPEQRVIDLQESVDFARKHLAIGARRAQSAS